MIGILRKCRVCGNWLSIDQYRRHLAKVCDDCSWGGRPKQIARSRAIALTPQGRAMLEELAAA